MRESYHNYIQP